MTDKRKEERNISYIPEIYGSASKQNNNNNNNNNNNVMAVPVLMYGSENWSLNGSEKRKIEVAEIRFLKPTAGYTLLDKKRSSDIREQLGT